MGRGSITLYIMIIAGMGIVLSGWWYRNIWFKVEEAIEIYVNVFWICVCFASCIKYLWMEKCMSYWIPVTVRWKYRRA